MKTNAKRKDVKVSEEKPPFPMVEAQAPRTPAELCRFVTLREHYKHDIIFNVQAEGQSLTVLSTDRTKNGNGIYIAEANVHHFDTQLEAWRHARDLRKLLENRTIFHVESRGRGKSLSVQFTERAREDLTKLNGVSEAVIRFSSSEDAARHKDALRKFEFDMNA